MAAAGNLPEDLLTDILSRIPVKSLLRFRCVHKTWHSLLKSSYFITTQSQNPKNRDRGFIFLCRGGSQFQLLTRDNFEVYSYLRIPFFAFRVVGSCNGLVCLYDASILEGTTIYLYNPCLKQHKIILQSTVPPPHDIDPIDEALGFGYDSMNNDFKVVRVVSGRCKYEEGKLVDSSSQAQVYSLRMKSWRKVGILPDAKFTHWAHQAVIHGAIHWLGHKNKTNFVVSFDLSSEVFKLFPILDCVGEACWDMKIDVYGDLLCVVKCVVRDNQWFCDIWTMGGYGLGESWTKVQAFQLFESLQAPLRFLGFGMYNKELLLKDHRGLIVYYPDKGAFNMVEASIGFYTCSILNFTESLVSLEEDNK